MAEKKISQRDYFNMAIEVAQTAGRDDLVEFFEGRIAALDKKNANRKPTKVQEANAELRQKIVDAMVAAGKPLSIAEIKAAVTDLADASSQKVVGILKGLGDSISKSYDKKTALFAYKGWEERWEVGQKPTFLFYLQASFRAPTCENWPHFPVKW